jgi:hypothetical protein
MNIKQENATAPPERGPHPKGEWMRYDVKWWHWIIAPHRALRPWYRVAGTANVFDDPVFDRASDKKRAHDALRERFARDVDPAEIKPRRFNSAGYGKVI